MFWHKNIFSLIYTIFPSHIYKAVFAKYNIFEVKSHSAKNSVLETEYNNIASCCPL